MIDATLTTADDVSANTYHCCYSPAEAARMLYVSESSVRRAAKRLGVKRIAGTTVAGFVRFDKHPIAVVLPYSD